MIPEEFHPLLRQMLDRELVAGNAVRSVGRDFPEPGSIVVQLRAPLRAAPPVPPDGVTHIPVNDPHWWMDEYRAGSPPHLLVG